MSELDLDRQRERLEVYKVYGNRGYTDKMKHFISNSFMKSPSYFDVLINGEPRGIQVIEGLEGNNFILTRPDERVSVGDLVVWEGEEYLVMFVRNNATVQVKAEIHKCNETLKWQDDEGIIHEVPCILMDKTSVYSDGLSKTKFISMGTDQISITVSTSVDVTKLPVDKRFIFNHDENNIYKTNRKDDILNKGLTLFVAKKSLYNPVTDSLALNLANYHGTDVSPPVIDETPPVEGLEIQGKSRLTIWDESVEYSVDTDQEVEWSLVPGDILEITKQVENKCWVSPIGTSKIGESTLRAQIVGTEKHYEKKIGLFYQ